MKATKAMRRPDPAVRAVRWVAALLLLALVPSMAAAEQATLKAVMILASDEPSSPDRRLASIEPKLRKVFRYAHYRHMGEGSLAVSLPGRGTIQLGGGYALDVSAAAVDGGRIQAQVTWRKGGTKLLSTSAKVQRNSPTVLGGASQGKGKLIVTLVVR